MTPGECTLCVSGLLSEVLRLTDMIDRVYSEGGIPAVRLGVRTSRLRTSMCQVLVDGVPPEVPHV